MIYELKEHGDRASAVEFIQGDYAKVAQGPKRYEETLQGDDYILAKIKELAEAV
jgi:hypothetical protein